MQTYFMIVHSRKRYETQKLSVCYCEIARLDVSISPITVLILNVCKGGGALCAGNAVALLVFGPVMP